MTAFERICEAILTAVEKAMSRKFLVWLIATYAFFAHLLTEKSWMWASMIYLGAQWALDAPMLQSLSQYYAKEPSVTDPIVK